MSCSERKFEGADRRTMFHVLCSVERQPQVLAAPSLTLHEAGELLREATQPSFHWREGVARDDDGLSRFPDSSHFKAQFVNEVPAIVREE
jgi:hypothetical protein